MTLAIPPICAAAGALLIMTATAHASCGSRPGTPNNVYAVPTSARSIALHWRNTTNKEMNKSGSTSKGDQPHGMYFDISVRDGNGNQVGRDITGGAFRNVTYGSLSSHVFENVAPSSTLCFQIRARTHAGTQGCVSQVFSARACATTPDMQTHRLCDMYATTALRQAAEMRGKRQTGACRAEGDRWSPDRMAHYGWCLAVRREGKNTHAVEEKARADALKACQGAPSAGPPPPAPAQSPSTPPPAPRVCTYNAVLTINACANQDGSLAEYLPTTALDGCGADEAEAVLAAKASFPGSLEEGDPGETPPPRMCYYSKDIRRGVCACSLPGGIKANRLPPPGKGGIKPSSVTKTVPPPIARCTGGMVMTGGRCACPSGTRLSASRRCIPVAIQNVPQQTPPNRIQTAPQQLPSSAVQGNRACPAGTAGRWPRCRPVQVR